ncbi:MAG: sigma-70 family RNA polymerase sigma factor [Coriobacteriaceae bacterium]|jgi:RNA polymerase sigma-70 factor (ECF subfamily)|nr:sigma-70 family RNA polymerase sigma factor [Coriobacteriaceae bacterium]
MRDESRDKAADKGLLASLRVGDTLALEQAIDLFGGYVAAVIRHTLGSQARNEDCEELVSDVFVALWQAAGSLSPESRLKPWLAVVARNKALNWARAQGQAQKSAEAAQSLVSPAGDAGPYAESAIERISRDGLIIRALETLDEESRELMIGHYLKERSIKELSEATGHSQSSIKSRLFRSRKVVRTYLQQEGYA